MGKIILKTFSFLLALLGIIFYITENEGIGIAAVVLAIIIYPLERRGVTQQNYNSERYAYDMDKEDEHRLNSNGDDSASNDSGVN